MTVQSALTKKIDNVGRDDYLSLFIKADTKEALLKVGLLIKDDDTISKEMKSILREIYRTKLKKL